MGDSTPTKETPPNPSPSPPKEKTEKQPEKPKQNPNLAPNPNSGRSQPQSSSRKNASYTCIELIDLALCSPEVGAVNFNILRMLLRDIVEKTGIDRTPVKLNDLEAHQTDNFKNYVQGTSVASPMPGVLRIGQQGPAPQGSSGSQTQDQAGDSGQPAPAARTPKSGGSRPPGPSASGKNMQMVPQELIEKVEFLEKQLESLYQLPSNNELLQKAKEGGAAMSVNDMWQIIQLNNRIAAAEAAIQKMASLIEDLAKNMGGVKSEARLLKKETDGLGKTNSNLALQGQELSDQCAQFGDCLNGIQKEINDIRAGWKHDRENLEKVLGVDLGKIPSFMRPKVKTSPRDGGPGESPSSQFERGTQTFIHKEKPSPKPTGPRKPHDQFVPPEEIAKMTPAEIMKTITPDEIKKMTPAVYKDLTPEQKKALKDVSRSMNTLPPQDQKRTIGVSKMTEKEIAKIPAKAIAERMPYEEAASLSPEVLEKMTDEQREKVQKIIDKGPSKKPADTQSPSSSKKVPSPRSEASEGTKSMGVKDMDADQIQSLQPATIVKRMTLKEAKEIPQKVLEKMTPDQKAAVDKVIQRNEDPGQKKQGKPRPPVKPPMGVITMTQDQLKDISPEQIAEKMSYDEAIDIPQSVLDKMRPEQREAIQKIIDKGPPPGYKAKSPAKQKAAVGLASMETSELQEVSEGQISTMPYEEAKNIPTEVLEQLSDEQREAIQKVIDAGPPELTDVDDTGTGSEYSDFMYDEEEQEVQQESRRGSKASKRGSGESKKRRSGDSQRSGLRILTPDEIDDIAELTAEDIAQFITPEQAAGIPDEDMRKRFTPQQRKEIERLKAKQKEKSRALKGKNGKLDMDRAAAMTASELAANLTPDQIEGLTEEDIQALPPAQAEVVRAARQQHFEWHEDSDDWLHSTDRDEPQEDSDQKKSKKDKEPKQHKPKQKPRKSRRSSEIEHPHVDVLKGPMPRPGEPIPKVTLEDYLTTLTPEQASNLAQETVQKEMEKQYKNLQGMQRQLAVDIQEKMEFIYQKLLKEIVLQNQATSPYMAIGGPEALGPGICTGHGMPAGVAVCQFPEQGEKSDLSGKSNEISKIADGQVCPGPGVCPGGGSEVCPFCVDPGGQKDLAVVKGPKSHGDSSSSEAKSKPVGGTPLRLSEVDESALQEMKSLMLLDLEKIRDDMRATKFETYDEQDMMERLGAVWEALKILKYNEEALAVKIARQDAIIRKLPPKTVEKLQKVPEDALEALINGSFGKGNRAFMEERRRGSTPKDNNELPQLLRSSQGGAGATSAADREDIQTLFNNLANVIAECSDLKEKIEQISDQARILESTTVTKEVLVDALGDKADKGQLNTKVSFDEFGNTIDELHTQLHNLMVEGYQRNENWKKVTADMAEELGDKLDKVELAPIRAFFKSHIRNLEDKVKHLSILIEEPDPAGTRKKLLKDYNCLSCDRAVSISGVTNGPTLPVLGPIPAGHPTASKRALDLHRMRMLRQFEPARKNMNALEKQNKQNQRVKKQVTTSARPSTAADKEKDKDVIPAVNRYTGGSHTEITNADLIASHRRPSKADDPPVTSSTANDVAPAPRSSTAEPSASVPAVTQSTENIAAPAT